MAWMPRSAKQESGGWMPRSAKAAPAPVHDDLPPMVDPPESGGDYDTHGSEKTMAFLRSLADSASFGFNDELAAGSQVGLDALMGNEGGSYEGYRDANRDELARLSEANPKSAIAGQIAGLVGPGAAANVGAKALTKGASKLTPREAAVIGGGEGAAMGAGGSDADNFGDLMKATGMGAVSGAAGGGAAGMVGEGVEAIGKKLIGRGMVNMAPAAGKLAAEKSPGIIQKAVDTKAKAVEGALSNLKEILEARMKKKVALRKMKKAQGRKGLPTKKEHQDLFDLLGLKNTKEGVTPAVRASDVEGSIAEIRRAIRDINPDLTEDEIATAMQSMIGDITDEIAGKGFSGVLKDTAVNMGQAAKQTVKDVMSGDIKKVGGQLLAGAGVGTFLGPGAGVATALTGGVIKNLDKTALRGSAGVLQAASGKRLEKLGRIGPTKAAAAGIAGQKTQEDRTNEWLNQQQSQSARKRMRNR